MTCQPENLKKTDVASKIAALSEIIQAIDIQNNVSNASQKIVRFLSASVKCLFLNYCF